MQQENLLFALVSNQGQFLRHSCSLGADIGAGLRLLKEGIALYVVCDHLCFWTSVYV